MLRRRARSSLGSAVIPIKLCYAIKLDGVIRSMTEDLVFEKNTNCQSVLIVEDNPADLLLLKKQLEKIWPNSKIMAVKSVREAYATYKKNDLDLVLLDLNLPDGYGPNTVQDIRTFNKSVPIVVITGFGTDLTISEALKLGANHVALKSQNMDKDFSKILKKLTQD
jgi:CheY-like chemotaxis protein